MCTVFCVTHFREDPAAKHSLWIFSMKIIRTMCSLRLVYHLSLP
jgi:hypothetical protein